MESIVNTFATENEYTEALHKLLQYDMAARNYCTHHKTNCIPVDITKTFPYANEINNELRSKIEVWQFLHEKPKEYFLYISEKNKNATTWMGDNLGSVSFGKEHTSNFGDKRQHVTVFGINGIKYYGTYFKSSGNYARIKQLKIS